MSDSTYRLTIGGESVEGGAGTYDIVNPATELVAGRAPEASVEQANAAVDAAADAFPAWSRTTPEERAELLDKAADLIEAHRKEIIPVLQAETGATARTVKSMQFFPATARLRRYAKGALEPTMTPLPPAVMPTTPLAPGGLISALANRQPVGVVTCITSYNVPMTNMAGKIGPALAMGNTVVVKPAPQDPLGVLRMVELMNEAGFPPGVVNVVTGQEIAPSEAVVAHPATDMVSFTGSTGVGQQIGAVCGSQMKRQLMELGGKGACIVFDDADLKAAIGGISSADPDTIVGPVITGTHRERIEGLVQAGVDEGATIAMGGGRGGFDTGFFVEPTLLVDCNNQMTPVREELFGPVVVVVPFDDDEEAIAIANDSDYGLYSYVFSADTARAWQVAQRLRSGNVGINSLQRNHEAPFGGFKQSGVGRDGGSYGLLAYSELQSIVWPS